MSGIGGVPGSSTGASGWLVGNSLAIGKNQRAMDADGDFDGSVSGAAAGTGSASGTKPGDLRAQILAALQSALGGLDPSASPADVRKTVQDTIQGVLKQNGLDPSTVARRGHHHHHNGGGVAQAAPADTMSQDPISADPTREQVLQMLAQPDPSGGQADSFLQPFLQGAPAGTRVDREA